MSPCTFAPLVGVDDVGDDAVAHDVVGVELDEHEIGDAVEDVSHREQARAAATPRSVAVGQVDLGGIRRELDADLAEAEVDGAGRSG